MNQQFPPKWQIGKLLPPVWLHTGLSFQDRSNEEQNDIHSNTPPQDLESPLRAESHDVSSKRNGQVQFRDTETAAEGQGAKLCSYQPDTKIRWQVVYLGPEPGKEG